MLPPGFLGTRADVLFDLLLLSLVAIVPLLAISRRLARRGRFAAHKRIQLWLGSVLGVVVLLFETHLRTSGGVFVLTRESRFAGTWLLPASVYFHMLFSVSTGLIWVGLILFSIRRIPSPPGPSPFSRTHRFWGRLAMIDMVLTGLTGIELYLVGFAL